MTEIIKIEKIIKDIASEVDFDISYETLKKFSEKIYGKADKAMFEHGLLLYLLVLKYKPKNILEIGTGGGFSSLFMMRSIKDSKISSKIFSIDMYSIDREYEKQIWKNNKKKLRKTTVRKTWSEYGPEGWENMIETRTGFSTEVLVQKNFPKFDMIFIDGGHDYESVRHDFYSILEHISDNFVILFDDYIVRPFYGVKKFVDEEISPTFETKIIETGMLKINSTEERMHARCLIESKNLKIPIREAFPNYKIQKILDKHRREKKLVKRYRKVLDKVPFFKNKRIKFWKTN